MSRILLRARRALRGFDRVIIADWSAANVPSPLRPSPDAIWLGLADKDGLHPPHYHRTRASAEAMLRGQITAAQAAGQRLLIGCDFPFGYPQGFALALTGSAKARAIWDYLAAHIRDGADNANNRFDLANAINARFGNGPFWGRPAAHVLPHLPARKAVDYTGLPFAERRVIEQHIPRAQPVWKLFTTGSVGSQSLMGLPMIARLAQMDGVSVWPFDQDLTDVVLAEVYPSLLDPVVAQRMAAGGQIKDAVQVQVLAAALLAQAPAVWQEMLALPDPAAREEGWILGWGFAPRLMGAL